LTQVVKLQTDRLFEAMCLGRRWPAADWRECLADHPLMRHIIATLVWQAEDPTGQRLLFRPTPEGDLLDAADDVPALPAGVRISLAHRVQLTPAEAEQWRDHLADYQVKPVFDQFTADRPAFPPDTELITDHQGWLSDSFAIRTRATKRGYSRSATEDGGWFNEYRKEMPGLGIEVVIGFTGSYLPEEQIAAAVTDLFFRSKSGQELPLAQVPPVLAAESYADYIHVAEAGAFDPEWQAKSEF
jgi:hypothetical protein